MNNIDNNKYFTAYIVRDSNTRRFLNRPAYSGRLRGIWGKMGNAQIFFDKSQAHSCASNINHRRPDGYSAYYAEVRPVLIERRQTLSKSKTKKS